MIALLAPPTDKPAFDCAFARDTPALDAGKIARLIAELHGAIVSPHSPPAVAAAARRALFAVLGRTTEVRLPFMIVPPIEEPPAEPDPSRERCKRRGALPMLRHSSPTSKRARKAASSRIRANRRETRPGRDSSRPLASRLTEPRGTGRRAHAQH